MQPIYLASRSPRRSELIADMGLPFTVVEAHVDEKPLPGEAPRAYALRLALEKAESGAALVESGLVIGADTIVVLDDDLLAKPADEDEALSHLARLRGRWHTVGTAVAIVDARTGRSELGIEWTDVRIRRFGPDELRDYVATGDPFDKAGGYAIQARPFDPVAEISGNEDNVVGLPRRLLRELLDRFQGS